MKTKKKVSRNTNCGKHGGRTKNSKELISFGKKYLKAGFSVALCRPGSSRAFDDADLIQGVGQLKAAVLKYPDANMAVLTGKASQLVAIGVQEKDRLSMDVFRRLERKYGPIDKTLVSARGARRFYFFSCDRELPSWFGKFGGKISLHGEEGGVMVEPSVVDGQPFKWNTRNASPPDLPDEWEEKLIEAQRIVSIADLKNGQDVPSDIQIESLIACAFSLRDRKLAPAKALSKMVTLNRSRCSSPLRDEQVLAICRMVFQRKIINDGLFKKKYRASANPLPQTISLAQIGKMKLTPLVWALKEILPEGVTLLVGPPKIGKSVWVLQAALAIANGTALWNGRPSEARGEVLYITYEDSHRRVKARSGDLLNGQPFPANLYVAYKWPRMGERGLPQLEAWLAAHPDTRMVVIDTLAKFRPETSTKRTVYDYDYSIGDALVPIARRHQVAIVLVHHSRKGDGNHFLEAANSTNGLTGGVDHNVFLRYSKDGSQVELNIQGRETDDFHWIVERKRPSGWIFIGEQADVQRSKARKIVIKALEDAGPLGPKRIAKLTKKSQVSIRVLLKNMLAAKEVTRSDDGKYSVA